MSKSSVESKNAPLPIGPYSQAIEINGLMFISGQIPLHPSTGEVSPGGIGEQTRIVLTHIRSILAETGLNLSHIVKTTVFLKSLSDFSGMNE